MSEERKKVDLSQFDNSDYRHNAPALKRLLWYFTNVLFFINPLFPFRGPKPTLLRMFGAVVGKGVVIHPGVNIKFPWKLEIGDHVWIGQRAWLDNIDRLTIGNNVNISQGALIILGDHDYKKVSHPTIYKPVVLEDGCWIGTRAIVTLGVRVGTHAMLTAGSVASKDMDPYMIYKGNPAEAVRERVME